MIKDQPVFVRKVKKKVPNAVKGLPDEVKEVVEYVEADPTIEPPSFEKLISSCKLTKQQ